MKLHDLPNPNAGHMANLCATMILAGNSSHHINLDRIAAFQGFDPVMFRALFLDLETQMSLQPSKEVTDE